MTESAKMTIVAFFVAIKPYFLSRLRSFVKVVDEFMSPACGIPFFGAPWQK